MKLAPDHLRFAVLASDTVLLTIRDGQLLVRLIPVNRPPHFKNRLGMPGGLLRPDETAEHAALRHMEEKGGISRKHVHIEQLYTFSEIDRDPRGRVVAVAYLALVPWEDLTEQERNNMNGARWVRPSDAKRLAYDHDDVLSLALSRLRSRATYTTVLSKLMPKEFTLTELERAYESVVSTDLDKRNFRKKILKLGILKELPHKKSGGRFRPARLYSFASQKVREIEVL